MKISLFIDGEKREFIQNFIPARLFRQTIEVQKKLHGEIDEKTLDALVEFLVNLFGKQFTIDQLYDGLDARLLLNTVVNCVNEVVEGGVDAIGAGESDPNVS